MITENDVPEIRRMAKAMGEKLIEGVKRRQDWPILARTFFSIVRLCDMPKPPLRSIEHKMFEALFRSRQSRIEDYIRRRGQRYGL